MNCVRDEVKLRSKSDCDVCPLYCYKKLKLDVELIKSTNNYGSSRI